MNYKKKYSKKTVINRDGKSIKKSLKLNKLNIYKHTPTIFKGGSEGESPASKPPPVAAAAAAAEAAAAAAAALSRCKHLTKVPM